MLRCDHAYYGDLAELAVIGLVYVGVVQTCTTSSRVIESFELVLPRGMPQAVVHSLIGHVKL
ncbi:hypothetical protein Taro_014368 [Colocasia esculenta]|uniref:Uncharacterized protein n=1 Tax=Colocasia esculenta TaxID=4460 RepID=A0A843ULL9_COLES|nr:hypothetical protein [Colocasia esculenta]